MKNERVSWIDSLKGIGILLVVFDHSGVGGNIEKVILSFHMPLFFYISGYLFNWNKEMNFKKFIKKKVKSLLIPYFFFAIISYCIWAFIERRIGSYDVNLLKPLIGIFYSNNFSDYMIFNGPLWFITCLFVVEVLFFLIQKAVKRNKVMIIIFMVSAIFGYLNSIYIRLMLPWGIDIAFTAISFYAIGYFSKGLMEKMHFSNKYKMLMITLSSLLISFILAKNNSLVFMYNNIYGNYIYFYLAALFGILAFVCISMIIDNSKVLNYLGKNTLIILAVHFKIILVLRFVLKLSKINNLEVFSSPLYKSIIFTIITLAISCPIITIINKWFPFILGRSKYRKESEIYN